jgi:(1->4)-alpha-D-glucan 1-alpha-D-glucosylmutase
VLSEMPAAWRLALRRWARLNKRYETQLHDLPAPDRNDQYLLYQTLLGIWPSAQPNAGELDTLRQRVQEYMRKAVREAKIHSSWGSPDEAYETALAAFIDGLLARLEPNPFLHEFHALHAMVARCGLYNSLAQTVLKLTSPGVPDIYQGNELWDFSLVDPDNRRAVDYARRRALLADLRRSFESGGEDAAHARELFDSMDDGRLKLYVIWRALTLRARRPVLFERGRYVALPVAGAHAAHVCAFARVHEGGSALTVVPRLLLDLTAGATRSPLGTVWADTRIVLPSPMTYRDVLTGAIRESRPASKGARLTIGDLFDTLPVAVLETVPVPASATRPASPGTRHASIQR